jgi:23S rRNA (cytosine1962-C5)-methyltransferase
LDAVAELGFAGVYLKRRPKHASVVADTRRDAIAPSEPQRGHAAPDPLTVCELGLPYLVRLGDGLSTGLFLDQRAARAWLREACAGKRVLNLFAYHGGFTVAAVAGGARETVSVDASGVALERAAENLALHDADRERHQLVRGDASAYLRKAAAGEPFDVIVLDPPSFATTRRSTFRATRDYRPLAAACMRCLAPSGILFASTNHRGITRAKLRRHLEQAADDAGRRIVTMTDFADPLDFPAAPGKECHLTRVMLSCA